MLSIEMEKTEDVMVVRCAGRIVRGAAVCSLNQAVVSERNTRIVVLDLSDVEMIDAGGLTALVALHHWTCRRGIQLKLVNPTHFVREVLERTRLDHVFDISSLQDVLGVLRAGPSPQFHHAFC